MFEVFGDAERHLPPDEKLADMISKYRAFILILISGTVAIYFGAHYRWEASAGANADLSASMLHVVLRKRLWLVGSSAVSVEMEESLIIYQCLFDIVSEKFPISSADATLIVALRAQVEFGDYIMDKNVT